MNEFRTFLKPLVLFVTLLMIKNKKKLTISIFTLLNTLSRRLRGGYNSTSTKLIRQVTSNKLDSISVRALHTANLAVNTGQIQAGVNMPGLAIGKLPFPGLHVLHTNCVAPVRQTSVELVHLRPNHPQSLVAGHQIEKIFLAVHMLVHGPVGDHAAECLLAHPVALVLDSVSLT